MYSVVLREAGREAEVGEWLDRRLLLEHWPRFVRDTWESAHPELRAST